MLCGKKAARLGLGFIWIPKTSKKYLRIPELAAYIVLGYQTPYWSR
jgi:hypothetical protein